MMLDRHISDVMRCAEKQTVYIGIIVAVLDHFPPHFIRDQPEIAGADLLGSAQKHPGGHPVKPAGQILAGRVGALLIYTVHKIIAFSLFPEDDRNLGRMCLQIVVHPQNQVSMAEPKV